MGSVQWTDRALLHDRGIFEALAKMDVLKNSQAKPDSNNQALTQGETITQATIKDVIVKQQDKIPKLAGDAKKFQEWFELYESGVSTGSSPLEKFEKLKSSLIGNALRAISHLSLNEEFYQTATRRYHQGCIRKRIFGSTCVRIRNNQRL